jgi:predicted phosphatase
MLHLFDLDLTIWEAHDKHGNHIWAKQLIFPLVTINNSLVTDDVGSQCSLKPGIAEYLNFLKSSGADLGFVSAGRHSDLPDAFQPSLHLIELFDLKKYFNSLKILSYKDQKKSQHILNLAEQITFYDDDDRVIEDVKKVPGVKVVDAKKITDWSLYVGV